MSQAEGRRRLRFDARLERASDVAALVAKGVVTEERRWRKQASGKSIEPREAPRETLARKLRKLPPVSLADLASEGQEFTLLVARRTPEGLVQVLGEVPDDIAMLERAARKLLD